MTETTPPQTLAAALQQARQQGVDRLDATLLLLHALGRSGQDRAWLLAHDADALSEDARVGFTALVARRAAGEPLAYLTGHREFFGLDLQVDARVLVPRPDTETLVNWALEVLPAKPHTSDASSQPWRVLDLGTGSGAIALALKAQRPQLQVQGSERSDAALAVARGNAQRLGLDVAFSQGHWLVGVQQRYQLIVANPPYIASTDPHLLALRYEPLEALTAGVDGLQDLRAIIASAAGCLQAGGWLLLEHGYDQASQVCHLLKAAGFKRVQSRLDLAGIARCSGGQVSDLGETASQ
ncbi:MAG: peptide chain release factor N(5)-glutamine methyltransferase [Betaproteobacteria bacterium]